MLGKARNSAHVNLIKAKLCYRIGIEQKENSGKRMKMNNRQNNRGSRRPEGHPDKFLYGMSTVILQKNNTCVQHNDLIYAYITKCSLLNVNCNWKINRENVVKKVNLKSSCHKEKNCN